MPFADPGVEGNRYLGILRTRNALKAAFSAYIRKQFALKEKEDSPSDVSRKSTGETSTFLLKRVQVSLEEANRIQWNTCEKPNGYKSRITEGFFIRYRGTSLHQG